MYADCVTIYDPILLLIKVLIVEKTNNYSLYVN